MKNNSHDAFALIIDSDAFIKKYIGHQNSPFKIGDNLVQYVEKSSAERFMSFLQETNDHEHSLGGEIIFNLDDKLVTTTISMIRFNEDIICLSLNESESTIQVLNEIITINNRQTNMLRKVQAAAQQSGDDTQTIFLEEVTKLNSELVNTQRKLEQRHQELSKLNKKLDFLGNTDYLTKAGNRRKFFKDMIALAKHEDIILMMMDFNHFKRLNDASGHSRGDEALIAFCDLVWKYIEPYEGRLYRIGGDEFIVAIPVSTNNDNLDIETLIKRVDSLLNSFHKDLSLAYGKTLLKKNDAIEKKHIESVLVKVDKNMYKHKSIHKKP